MEQQEQLLNGKNPKSMNSFTCWQMSLALGLEAGGWGALVERASANGNPLLAHHNPSAFAGLAATLARRCGVCLATFPSAWLLERHALLQHAGQSNDNEKPFTCEQCGQRYRYRSAYVKHREQNHRARLPADKLFTCDVCGMQFRYLKSFKKHRLNHALERLQRASEHINSGGSGSAGGDGDTGGGDTGGDSGGGGGSSSNGIVESGSLSIARSVAERSDQVSSTGEPSQLETRCDTASPISNADDLTRTANILKNHPREVNTSDSAIVRESHEVDDQIMAVERGGVSAITGNLVGNEAVDADESNHDRVIDDERHGATERVMAAIVRGHDSDRRERRFACPFCGKCVRSKENLKLHVRKHTGERPFVCLFCGRAFGGKSDLTRHLRIHTGERPYHCEMCGKCFARADYLSKHLTTHIHQR